MNCHRVQSLLSAYLDQELSTEERRLIRNHIFNCPVCAQSYDDLSSVKSYLGSLEPPAPPLELFDRLNLVETVFSQPFTANPWLWSKRLLLTSACVCLFLLTSFYLFPVNTDRAMISYEAAPHHQRHSVQYQLVSEESNSINLSMDEVIDEKETKEKNDNQYFPTQPQFLPGIPVSR